MESNIAYGGLSGLCNNLSRTAITKNVSLPTVGHAVLISHPLLKG